MSIHDRHCPFCGAQALSKVRWTQGRQRAFSVNFRTMIAERDRGLINIGCLVCDKIIGPDNEYTRAFIERLEPRHKRRLPFEKWMREVTAFIEK